jgi:DNA-binding IclR family transcriptional regulator
MMTPQHIAPYVLRALAQAQTEGRCMDLETLSHEIEVRKADVRKTVTALHQEGLVDALRLRLSLRGFVMGRSLLAANLGPIRRPVVAGSTPEQTTEQSTERVAAA